MSSMDGGSTTATVQFRPTGWVPVTLMSDPQSTYVEVQPAAFSLFEISSIAHPFARPVTSSLAFSCSFSRPASVSLKQDHLLYLATSTASSWARVPFSLKCVYRGRMAGSKMPRVRRFSVWTWVRTSRISFESSCTLPTGMALIFEASLSASKWLKTVRAIFATSFTISWAFAFMSPSVPFLGTSMILYGTVHMTSSSTMSLPLAFHSSITLSSSGDGPFGLVQLPPTTALAEASPSAFFVGFGAGDV
mmetsp:Transcript_65928/g.193315  ORF Transcript_65928/g.193315 Transcript_65928/m.193315 type:complete len:248 (-) Transcript_65928:192-935(-)